MHPLIESMLLAHFWDAACVDLAVLSPDAIMHTA